MPEAQPGQEQRMEICPDCNGAGGDNQHTICGKCSGSGGIARPTADLGDDGELVALLGDGEWWQTVVRGPNPTSFSADLTHVARQARDRLILYREAMQEFCDRVDRGEIRSTKTYNKFKALLA